MFLLRLIPTCVGSTMVMVAVPSPVSAHPHVCGEHYKFVLLAPTRSGSSPRVWGALPAHQQVTVIARLIPTCVGSTVVPGV